MATSYFSDSESGMKARTEEEISDDLWGSLVGLIQSELGKQSFAYSFPVNCEESGEVYDTDQCQLSLLLKGQIQEINWPLDPSVKPDKLAVLDLIQFCFQHIYEAEKFHYHAFLKHHHLSFDRQAGQDRFRDSVNLLFARNGSIFNLTDMGSIVRLGSPVFHKSLEAAISSTGDATLDCLLDDARSKFTNPDPKIRREGLEKLWDAWERIKTLEPGKGKKDSTKKILDHAASEPNFRAFIESEATELTRIGNDFRIRHSETSKYEIYEHYQVDYLFYRMFSLINLLLTVK